MKKYEVMYIINANVDEDQRAALINNLNEIITNNGGSVGNVDEWGIRDFAYPIDHMTKGYYVVTKFSGDNDTVNEFDRLIGLNKSVVRHMITVDQSGK